MLERLNNQFEYKRLTEAEQKARGILGRLVGPCADFVNPTRNGRKYSEQLWENVFENPIMKEKIANRCCFGELNHPADRTETDMEKVAICLAELPKKGKDGKLYGVFDILSTPNGRILKALCDYGCNIGISSRGQGDLVTDDYGDESVDPDTYECECFDVVLVPGVESARLKYVTESLDKKPTLKQALLESLSAANDNERKIMEETLNNLNINIKEEKETESETPINDLIEIEEPVEDAEKEATDDVADVDADENGEETDTDVETAPVDEPVEVDKDTLVTSIEDEVIEEDEVENDFDKGYNAALEKILELIDTIAPDSEEEEPSEEDEGEENTEEINSADEATDDITVEEEKPAEAEEPVEEALDEGVETLVNSLKEALKGKSDLENTVKALQEKLAVSDAKVSEINEECSRYKNAVARLSVLAKSNKDLKDNVSKLEESLETKDKTIEEQNQRIARLVKSRKENIQNSNNLTESVSSKEGEIAKLNESLTSAKNEYESKLSALNEQLQTAKTESDEKIAKLTENVNKATTLKESYKKLANKAVNKYIEVKSENLGLTPTDIKRKLGESYTLDDVDKVCEDLKAYNINVGKLSFDVNRKVSVKVSESRKPMRSNNNQFSDDDVDDTLIRLANSSL